MESYYVYKYIFYINITIFFFMYLRPIYIKNIILLSFTIRHESYFYIKIYYNFIGIPRDLSRYTYICHNL